MFHILRATAPCPVLMYCSLFWSSAQVSQYARWQTIFYKEKRDFIFLFINISSKPSLSLSVNEADLVIKVINCQNLMFYHIFKYLYKSIKSHLGSKISNFFIFQDCFCSVRTKYGHRSYRLGIYFYFWQSQPVYQIHLQRSYKRV